QKIHRCKQNAGGDGGEMNNYPPFQRHLIERPVADPHEAPEQRNRRYCYDRRDKLQLKAREIDRSHPDGPILPIPSFELRNEILVAGEDYYQCIKLPASERSIRDRPIRMALSDVISI